MFKIKSIIDWCQANDSSELECWEWCKEWDGTEIANVGNEGKTL